MKLFHTSSIILLATTTAPALAQQPLPVNDALKAPDKRLREYWAKSTCIVRGDGSEPNVKKQCEKVCFPNPDPNKMSASTCWLSGSQWLDGSSGKPLADQHKNIPKTAIKGGYCGCDDPIILFAGDFFIKSITEAGKIIEKVVCPALQALDIVIEFGSLAIPPPGKAIQGGMIAAVKTAKAYKYAYEAQDAAQEWANMIFGGLSTSQAAGCGAPPFSLAKLAAKFLDFANVPDATLPGGLDYKGLPCPKGGCKGTRQGEKPKDKPQDKPKSDSPAKTSAPPSKTTSDDKWTPSATAEPNCKAIHQELESLQPAAKRQVSDTFHSRRSLYKRKPKDGVICKQKKGASKEDIENKEWNIYSFDYPSNPGDPDAKSAKELGFDSKAYGWAEPTQCKHDKYWTWGGAFFKKGDLYDTEHILEWSVITQFFTQLNSQYKSDEFEHPDPAKKAKKVDFCEYFKASWNFQQLQEIPNPAPNSGAKPKFVNLKPIEWIAANYPYKDRKGGDFMGEFKLLQKTINSPAKNNMFAPMEMAIYNDDDMKKLITPPKMPNKPDPNPVNKAIARIRSVIGAFHYLQEEEIANILKREKVRIGTVIESLDKELPKTPRKDGNGAAYKPWKPLGLGAKWDKYMDGVYKTAKDKGTKFVEDNIKRLKDEYESQKAKDAGKDDPKKSKDERINIKEWAKLRENVEKSIKELEDQWKKGNGDGKVKAAKDWAKPW